MESDTREPNPSCIPEELGPGVPTCRMGALMPTTGQWPGPRGPPPPLSRVLSLPHPLLAWPARPRGLSHLPPSLIIPLGQSGPPAPPLTLSGPPGRPRGSSWHQMPVRVCPAKSLGAGEAEALFIHFLGGRANPAWGRPRRGRLPQAPRALGRRCRGWARAGAAGGGFTQAPRKPVGGDRKSTRLNSSH